MTQKDPATTTSTSTASLPSYVQPYVTNFLNMAQTAATQPYVANPNQQVAPTSAATNTAAQQIQGIAAAGTPAGVTAAQKTAAGIAGAVPSGVTSAENTLSGIAGYQPQQITSANLSQYEDPYTQQVIDVQKQQANQDFAEQQGSRDTAAVQVGAFGGDRATIANQIAQQNLNTNLQGIEANGLNTAYNNAVNEFQTQQNENLQGKQLGINAASAQGGLANNEANLQLNAASTEGNLASSADSLALQNATALSGVGTQQQQQAQNVLNATNAAWTAKNQYPVTQADLYSKLLAGTYSPQTSTATTTPPPSLLSQIGGLATAAVGAYGAATR